MFYQLLQIAIGNRKELSHNPTVEEWMALFDMAKKHSLVAVAFRALSKLKGIHSAGFSADDAGEAGTSALTIDKTTYLKWLGLTAKIAQRNKVVTRECVQLSERLAHDGMMCCIIKGQSNLVNYPEELRECRTPGDIDVLMRSMEKPDAIDFPIRYCIKQCHKHDVPVGKICYHHMDMPTGFETSVEAHHRAVWLNSPIRNWRLQNWLEDNMPFHSLSISPLKVEGSFPCPSASYNAIYQLLHIYKHMFEEGIGLRQLLDYYFVLRSLHIEQGSFADRTESMAQWAEGMGIAVKSNEEIMHTLCRFGMKKFASATMYVLMTVFSPSHPSLKGQELDWQTRWPWMICKPDEKEGKFLLNEIMQAGNFGKYDTRIAHETSQMRHTIEKTKHNLRLLTHYPEEVLWEPIFRIYHFFWRKLELWRFL